ncbi:Bug family tripartite tricarboxylate transporter substrate binding protein [Aquabacterium sp.]|uniref:Bug family tripartite tricarboxylate transporter substrate binding protein n=1 Tax=Aquabacterium sp. TaxID=1872578 RepID=UPI002C78FEF7|nr:Bug family tripartite tricarboxylate transporter substrate binding protein [Aquabacterium sp.]HSW07300.1 Bug family tripartite tricarboxylate transporter substrate binding protein [Aquabacterium sp.]
MIRSVRSLLALCLALGVDAVFAQASDVPARIVVGFPAGGSADTIARVLGDKLREDLKRPVVVENRPGAGGRILAAALKTLPTDGSVVMLAPDSLATTNPFVFKKLGYEVADLVPVSMVAEFPFALATSAEVGPKTFAEFLKLVRDNPKRADFGSPAAGSPLHFVGLMVGRDIGVDLLHVPFQGGAALVTALVGGQPTAGVNTLTDMLEMHKAGKLRILAVTGAQRAAVLPDVPTFAELGVKQVIARGFFGLYAPAGTSAAAVTTWNTALRRVLQLPDVRERLGALAFTPRASTPEELVQLARDDAAVWGPVIKASGFSVD